LHYLLTLMSNTNSPPTSSTPVAVTSLLSKAKAATPFGPHIEGMAALFGIHPKDTALAVASILGGIAGPYAGFVTPTGHRVRTGINVLRLGASNPVAAALEDVLLHPVRTRSRFLRGRAHGMSRTLVDQWVFGAHGNNMKDRMASQMHPWMKERDHLLDEQQSSLIKSSLPQGQFDEQELQRPMHYAGRDDLPACMSAGIDHLPSVLFEHLELLQLKSALRESLHREALFFHPIGGMFGRSSLGTSKDEAFAADLAGYLLGRDTVFETVHRDQGHGTFEHARIHLWATVSTDRIGAILHAPMSQWNDVLRSCLIWDPSPSKTADPLSANCESVITLFGQIVQRVFEARCFGGNNRQLRLMLSRESAKYYPLWRREFNEYLVQLPESCREYTSQFHDLPERLLWMFLQFEQEQDRETPNWSPMRAAFCTAQYAMEKHLEILQRARAALAETEANRTLKTVTTILKRKGPCNLRAMQRSTDNLHASSLRPGLEQLQRQGLVDVDAQHRYFLTAKEN
jgi:hypothetical protein